MLFMMKKPGPWDWVGIATILALAMTLFAMQKDKAENGPPADQLLFDPSAEIQLGDEWMGLYFRGEKAGLLHVRKSKVGEAYRFEVETNIRMVSFGQEVRLELKIDANLSADLTLENFRFEVDAGPARMSGGGEVSGEELELKITTAGTEVVRTIELKKPPVLRSTIGPMLSREEMIPGKKIAYQVFDPMTQQDQTIEIEVIGPAMVVVFDKEVPVTHIRQKVSGLVLNGWINQRGEMLRQELGLGLTAVRETEEQARFGLRGGTAGADLVGATMVEVGGLPPRLTDWTELSLKVDGVDLSSFELNDARQSLTDDTLTIRREPRLIGLQRPVLVGEGVPTESLAPEALIQADHPRIINMTRRIIGEELDTIIASKKIMAWLHKNMDQSLVAGIPSALEVLDTRTGDCNEHSTLFAAMARSAGIPTRMVVGLVYKDGRFGYHAWNEILGADGWVSVDTTWNQLPADVGHIAFLRGGLREQVRLLPLMGQIKLTRVQTPQGASSPEP